MPSELALGEAVREILGSVADARSAAEVGDAAAVLALEREIVAASRSFRSHWTSLEPTSPYRGVALDQMLEAMADAAEIAWSSGQPIAAAVEDERVDLVVLRGRLLVSLQLLPVAGPEGIRAFAKRSGLAVGTVADIVNGKAGPPSSKTARLIDIAAGTDTESICRSTRDEAATIRRSSKERAHELSATGPTPLQDRVAAVALQIAMDDALLALVERVAGLPGPVRDGLSGLLASLGERG